MPLFLRLNLVQIILVVVVLYKSAKRGVFATNRGFKNTLNYVSPHCTVLADRKWTVDSGETVDATGARKRSVDNERLTCRVRVPAYPCYVVALR